MASYAHTFTSGDTLTPTKLNNARTVSDIVNADIKSDAAIAGTKIAPAFGSQNVSATGSIQSNGTGSSFSQINGGNADGAFVRLCRGGSATQNAYLAQFQGSLFIKNNDSGVIAFNTTTSDIERMRIDASGNVGIGTTAPATVGGKFCVVGSSGVLATITQNNATGNVTFGGSYTQHTFKSESAEASLIQVSGSGSLYGGGGSFNIWNSSNAPVTIGTNGVERMRIMATGQVRFQPLSADPSGAASGDVYYNSSTNKLRVYNGTSWVDLH